MCNSTCDKYCEIGGRFKDCEIIKTLANDLVITFDDEVLDIPETTPISPSDEINYWLILAVLLSVACLILLVAIAVKYCMSRGLTVPCF